MKKRQGFENEFGEHIYEGDKAKYLNGETVRVVEVYQDGEAWIIFPDKSGDTVKWWQLRSVKP